ncbi:MAG: Flp pilus assembly protein CpaB [Dehalococcoidia bacterium]|nr:Flp pilus assembly protein CpaB [Dehalococcoidia bacterium]MBK9545375.1 Flp pilus assembly protein CpaB [Dehalococcoidia bacterium]
MNRTIAAASSSSSRNRGVLLLAAVFGILSAMLMFAFLNSRGGDNGIDEQLNSGAGAETVVVVTRNVNVGEKITADMLGTKTMPAAALVDGHIKDSEATTLVGQVAVAPLYSGEQVLTSKISTYEGQNTIAWKVPDGMRALGLMVPHEAWIAGGLPQPGDMIDILGITAFVTVDPLTGQERPDLLAGYIAQNVQVLAVAQSVVKTVPKIATDKTSSGAAAVSENAGAQAVATGDETGTYEKSISITIALPPDLVAKVALIDAMEDDVAQYRILPRQKGDADPISGKTTYKYEDIFPAR